MKTLDNKKVFVSTPETSKAVQEKAFKLGYRWELYGQRVSYTNQPFIFFFTPILEYCKDFNTFANSDFEEITAAEILEMDIPEPEEIFEPFQKVLVRSLDDNEWQPAFYKRKHDKYCHTTLDGSYQNQCIDYETNKHFAFTTGKP